MKIMPARDRVLWIEHAGFSFIVLLSWLSELFHVPQLVFGDEWTPNWTRAALRTVVVIAVWAWVHLETKRLLRRVHHLEDFLLICSWCRRIGEHGKWVSMEKYFGSRFDTRTTHGMCPECVTKVINQAENLERPAAPDISP